MLPIERIELAIKIIFTHSKNKIYTNMPDKKPVTARELDNMLDEFTPTSLVIAFFINNVDVSQDEWLNPLAKFLKNKGFVTVGITTPTSAGKCDLSQAEFQCLMEPSEISKLKNIHVFMISDMDRYSAGYPAQSKVVGCCHGLEEGEKYSLSYQTGWGSTLDAYLVSFPVSEVCKEMITELWDGLLNRETSKRKSPYFHVIPVGYPRIHVLHRELSLMQDKPDSILYAPVGIASYQNLGGERVKKHGKKIIRTLLASFPGINVIFRPYKNDWDDPAVKEIEDYFKTENRFIVDKNTGRAASFARSALCVTDYSHIANSFSYATLRPTIIFRPWGKGNTGCNNKLGAIVYSYTSFIAACKNAFSQLDAWKEKIESNRRKFLAPFENSFAEIADWIEDLYNGKSRANWVDIKRYDPKNMPGEIETAIKFLKQPGEVIPCLAAVAAVYSYPASALMLALSYHFGYIFIPDSSIYSSSINNMAENILSKPFDYKKYCEINPDDILMLYKIALLEKIKDGKQEDIALIENLLANFKEYIANHQTPHTRGNGKPG